MNHSETLGALAAALSAAQSEIKPAAMNATNPFLKNKYADLGSVIDAAKPVMAKHGLSYSQLVTGQDGAIGVETMLMHQSGEWLSSAIALPMAEERGKSMAQVAGSIITYLRRYALAAALGIYADEDIDGHAPEAQQERRQRVEPQFDDGTPLTDGTRKRMFALLGDRGITDEDAQRAGMSRLLGREVESRSSLTEAEGRRVIASLEGASA